MEGLSARCFQFYGLKLAVLQDLNTSCC